MKIEFQDKPSQHEGALVLGVFQGNKFPTQTLEIDEKAGGLIKKALTQTHFKGKKGDQLVLNAPSSFPCSRLILIGLGEEQEQKELDILEIGAHIYTSLTSYPDQKAIVDIPLKASLLAHGASLRAWRFDKYKTKKDDKKPQLTSLTFCTPHLEEEKQAYSKLSCIEAGVFLTREVVAEPANVITPQTMAEKAKELETLGVKVEIFNKEQLKKMGLNALLAVGQGSASDPYLVVMSWQGGTADQKPLAVVGKGVTFDSGGISLKPSKDMDEMKWDMAGAGAVLGVMKTLAMRKAKANVVGVMGLAENMPSGTAQRPGDIVKSLSGQTIEVLNTDAEGRMVLADAIWYTQDRFKPQAIIDLATLTGAIIIALGHEYAGLFSSDDKLASQILEMGEATGEFVWRMPLCKAYDKDIDSQIADMKNTGSGRGAGSATAAHFLKRYTNDIPWAHLDIAGVAWESGKEKPLSGKGATGFGVRLLNAFIEKYIEA